MRITHLRIQRPSSLRMASITVTVLALIFCVRQSAGQSGGQNYTLCDALNHSLFDVVNQTFNDTLTAEGLGWADGVAEKTEVLKGICKLVALRNLAKYVQGTGGVYLDVLLGQNVQDACKWLYGSSAPDPDCEVSLLYYCFRLRTKFHELYLLLDNASDGDKCSF